MNEEIRAQHIASFLEHDEPLDLKDIKYNLGTIGRQRKRIILECFLRIVDGEYLTVRVEDDKDPSECFDLCYLDAINVILPKSKDSDLPSFFMFRFLVRNITDGEGPNEVHVFRLKDCRMARRVCDIVKEAVDQAKRMNKQSRPRHQPTHTVSRKKNAINRPERIKHHTKGAVNGGTTGKLEELNQLVDEIEGFELMLHDAVSFQVTGATKVDRTLWRDSLNPPPYDAAVDHVVRIRTCINVITDLHDHIEDPGPGELLNRLFESLWWVQKICDGNRVLHYDPDLVRSVWRPALSERAIRKLSDYLQTGNKSFWQSLGDAWTIPGGKPADFNGDVALPTRSIQVERSGFKPEMTIKDYGYYRPLQSLETKQTKQDESIDMEKFINGVRARGGTLVLVKQKNVSEAARELSVNVGDILEVLDDNDEWSCLRTPTGQTGHVPRRCIEVLEDRMTEPKRRSTSRSRSKSPREKKATPAKPVSVTARKFKKAPPEPDSETSETASTDDNYDDGGYVRQSAASRTTKRHSCISCCDGGNRPCHHHHHSMSPPRQDPIPTATSQQYQPMNVQALQQRPTGQPIIHQGGNGQPSVIVVPSAPQQSAPPRAPPVHYLVTQPPPQPPPPAPQPVIVPMPFPMQQPMMQQPMMQQPMMQQPMMQQPMMQPHMMQPSMMQSSMMPGMAPYGIYGTLPRGSRPPMDPFYDAYMNYEGVPQRRHSSSPPKRSTRHKQKKSGRRKKKASRSKSSSSSSRSSSSSSSFSSSSSSTSDDAKGRSKNKKHNRSKKESAPQAPPPPPPPTREDNYDAVNQTVRKQRFLSQMPGHKPPPHMETMNRELQERMKSMREGNSNGLKPASRRKLTDSWNASQISSSNVADPAAEIAQLANKFGTAQVS